MYASIRAYRLEAGSMDALMHRVDRDFADALSREPGFAGHHAIATGHDTLVSICLFGTPADAQRSAELAEQWFAEDLSDFRVQPVDASSGEVMVSRAASRLLEPAHH